MLPIFFTLAASATAAAAASITTPGTLQGRAWGSLAGAVQELEEDSEPLNYGKLCEDQQIVLLGDAFRRADIHKHVMEYMWALKSAGVTAFGVEVAQSQQDEVDAFLETKGKEGLKLKTFNERLPEIILAAARSGMDVVAVDADPPAAGWSSSLSGGQRERRVAANIAEMARSARGGGKVAALLSLALVLGEDGPGVHLASDDGFRVRRVVYSGGPSDGRLLIDGAAREMGKDKQVFMVDLLEKEKESMPYGGTADYAVHLPQVRLQPGVLNMGEHVKMVIRP